MNTTSFFRPLLRYYRGKEKSLARLLSRFRYPGSLPEELGRDLGIKIPRASLRLTLSALIQNLVILLPLSKKLYYRMCRESAEKSFRCAFKKEHFHSSTLFSYYFSEGWLVFTLHFDEEQRLRRLHLQCPHSFQENGFDLLLPSSAVKTTKKDSLHSPSSL